MHGPCHFAPRRPTPRGADLHHPAVLIAAPHLATASSAARPLSSALATRLVHVPLRASAAGWLDWAASNGIHPWVYDYLTQRPDHLWSAPPKTEEPFSTPR